MSASSWGIRRTIWADWILALIIVIGGAGWSQVAPAAQSAASSVVASEVAKSKPANTAPNASTEGSKPIGQGSMAVPEQRRSAPDPTSSQLGIAFAIIMLMSGLFFVLFKWQHQIEQADFFSGLYKDAAETLESARLTGPIDVKWKRGDYLEEIFLERSQRGRTWVKKCKPRPVCGIEVVDTARRFDMTWRIESIERTMWTLPAEREGATANPFRLMPPGLGGSSESHRPGGTIDESGDRAACQRELDNFSSKASNWVKQAAAQAWDWYQDDLRAKEFKAKANAEKVLGVDFSATRGRGPEFVLEFTAVVVIIFSAVILGVLGILDSNQIGTLLAAIAGYVLGKSNSRSQPEVQGRKQAQQEPHEPQLQAQQ